MKKIAVFADVQNIYYTCRDVYGRKFNYKALMTKVSAGGEIVQANAYAIERNDDGQRKFQDALRYFGFDVKLKPFIQRFNGSAKGDWDVGIAIDVLDIAPDVDVVVLLSGDGDFDLLLQKIRQDYKTETEVYGVQRLTANTLVDSASLFHPIDTHLLL